MQKIVLGSNKRGNDFKVFSSDLWLNWLVPYFRNHKFVADLVFNRDFHNSIITLEFNVVSHPNAAFLRFANDLTCHLRNDMLPFFLVELSYKRV